MVRKLTLFAAMAVMTAAAAFAQSGDAVTVLDPDAVVLFAPPNAPLSIASLDGTAEGKTLAVRVVFRNDTAEPVYGPHVALIVFDAKRQPIGAATYRSMTGIEAGRQHMAELELPLSQPLDAESRVMAVPVVASTAAARWKVPPANLRLLAQRLQSAPWARAEHALALGRDVLPAGELVQFYPPNCSLEECGQNNLDCNDYCMSIGAHDTCAYCDRRRTGEPCSLTCYCRFIWEGNCAGDPY